MNYIGGLMIKDEVFYKLILSSRLRYCPICGGEAEFNRTGKFKNNKYYIECILCGLTTREFDTIEEAEEYWNEPRMGEDF